MNESGEIINDFREFKTIILCPDAEYISVQIIDGNTHINYISNSNPHPNCIEVIEGCWNIQNLIDNILTLKEQ